MKRFYERVGVTRLDGGHGVELDGRPIKTPKKASLCLGSRTLAEAIAEEWRRQGEDIRPDTMPMLRLANSAIDLVGADRRRIVDNLAAFGGSDMLCYRATGPEDLVRRQRALWSPWLTWAEREHGAHLRVTDGVRHIDQDPSALVALAAVVERNDDMELAALNDLVTIANSLLLALAVSAGALPVTEAWAAARLDEDYQAERWGLDGEAEARSEALRAEFEQAARFLELHRAG